MLKFKYYKVYLFQKNNSIFFFFEILKYLSNYKNIKKFNCKMTVKIFIFAFTNKTNKIIF